MRGILTVDFKPEDDFDGEEWAAEPCRIFIDDGENHDHILSNEQKQQWRANMAQVWTLVADNHSIRKLTIINLPPKATTTWFTQEWQIFLGQLEELSVGIWYVDNYLEGTTGGYYDFLSELRSCFFNYAKNLRHLSIVAAEENPWNDADSLQCTKMPELRSLNLKNCFIDRELISFLKAHAKTIKKLYLQNCLCVFDSCLVTGPVSWAELFQAVRHGEPVLCELRLDIGAAPLTSEEAQKDSNGAYIPLDDEPEDIKAIRKAVKVGHKKVFPYHVVDEAYGLVSTDEYSNVERFKDSEDQKQYDALMEVVRQNAHEQSLK